MHATLAPPSTVPPPAEIPDDMTEKRKEAVSTEVAGLSKKKQRAAAKAAANVGTGAAALVKYRHVRGNALERVAASPHDAWVLWDASPHTYALLDARPRSRGHALVVAKHASATLLEPVPDEVLCAQARDVQVLARALPVVTDCAGVQLLLLHAASPQRHIQRRSRKWFLLHCALHVPQACRWCSPMGQQPGRQCHSCTRTFCHATTRLGGRSRMVISGQMWTMLTQAR
jgi:hypothetical protein